LFSAIPDSVGGQVSTITVGGEDFRLHAFTNVGSDTFTIEGDAEVDVLVVGGGGGGGTSNGGPDPGGGGAGGLIFKPSHNVNPGSYTVTVGDGGTPGNNGDDSVFDNLTALGGGSALQDNPGKDGGSGGGAFENSGGGGIQPQQTGDSGTFGFGNDGGDGDADVGGGGGGAGAPGNDGFNDNPFGGDGLKEVTINGTTYNFANTFSSSFGEDADNDGNAWFAGGGSGGSEDVSSDGGKGGGADYPGDIRDGTPNTGGGGSGADDKDGGDGGSGIVLIRIGPL
jgi:hypothetical protein